MSLKMGKKSKKQVNYFSHEFVIQNHGDIFSIFAMVFVVGLLFKGTTPLAAKFVLMQHNETVDGKLMYHSGWNDLLACFFYAICMVVIHAIIQEYLLDKISKRMSMTKARLSRFNHSSQTAIFLASSVAYILHILWSDALILSVSDLWENYPHSPLSLWAKFFFIWQISYYLHNFPELYFQKVKREDMMGRVTPSLLFLIGISAGYWMQLSKLTLAVLLVQYSTDLVFYVSRACDLALKVKASQLGYRIWNTVFVPARLLIVCMALLSLQWGLGKNLSRLLRLNGLGFVVLSQAWMMWVFVNYQLKKRRERMPVSKQQQSKKKK